MIMTAMIENLRSDKVRNNLEHLFRLPVQKGNPVLAELDHFRIKLAGSPAEVKAAQRLRFRVFKEEQGRLTGCRDGIDRDRFDRYCRHLLVIDKTHDEVVGTYRVMSGREADAAGSFYSEGEFMITGLAAIKHEACEVGRSCVAPEFRSGAVVGLLWSGLGALRRRPCPSRSLLANYARRSRPDAAPAFHYLFGCVSLEDSDPINAMALYEYFRRRGMLSDKLSARPRSGFGLDPVLRGEAIRRSEVAGEELIRKLPPLFKGYLRLGAKICGVPAHDREFGTIDFLILLDMREIPERYARRFLI